MSIAMRRRMCTSMVWLHAAPFTQSSEIPGTTSYAARERFEHGHGSTSRALERGQAQIPHVS